jgi:hypothetical protein
LMNGSVFRKREGGESLPLRFVSPENPESIMQPSEWAHFRVVPGMQHIPKLPPTHKRTSLLNTSKEFKSEIVRSGRDEDIRPVTHTRGCAQ